MPAIPATIAVNFTSIYAGPHRVCYREVGAPSYTCTVPGGPGPGFHPICSGGGTPCSYDIPITVDNETCDQVDYEGYVQAACEDEASLNGRIPFNISFIPDPACKRYEVTCNDSPVGAIAITAPGGGYTIGTYPAPLVGGGGAGATAEAVVTGVQDVISFVRDSAGTGYNDGVYGNTAMDNLVGSGAGLEINLTIVGGVITVATLASGGTGYITGDTAKPNEGIVGVPGVIETFTLTADDTGTVTAINLLTPGSGYTSDPVVDLSGLPAGAGATADADLAGCGALVIYDCGGATATLLAAGTLQPGETYDMCGPSLPTVPSDFSIVQDGNCLCNCIEQDLQNTNPGGTIDYTYIDCNGSVVTGTLGGSASTGNVCMVDGSLSTIVNAPAVEAIVVVGACDAVP
jgi:hypothetical protein